MALAARVIAALPRPWRLAAAGLVLALAGCGDTVNNSLFDRLAAGPSVPMPARVAESVPKGSEMGGRWMLTMPGTGYCGMTFDVGAAQGVIAPEGGCPGKFIASRKWVIETTGLVIRDGGGRPLAELRMAEPGRLEGLTPDNEQVLLTR
jgi:Protease inhibitor Inh